MFCNWAELNRKEHTALCLCILFSLFCLAFIFSNSMKNADQSDMQSGGIVNFVAENILGIDNVPENSELISKVDFAVRKIAHFTEFAVLSFSLFFIPLLLKQQRRLCSVLTVLQTFLFACTDEFIQLFSEGRACRFYDIIIDTFGGVFAVFSALMILKISDKIKNKKRGFDE